MTFNDIFKSNFLENIASVTIFDMILSILLAFLLGLFIYFVYRKTFSGVALSHSFGISLIAMTMITTLVILAVTSNVVLSLGMVGALSIVRFRTAIKEPLDVAFLFWAIGAGIVLAAGMIPLAVFGSVALGAMLLLFLNLISPRQPYIAVVRCQNAQAEANAAAFLQANVEKCQLKSKTIAPGQIEANYQLRLREGGADFLQGLCGIPGVESAVLVSYNGEYLG